MKKSSQAIGRKSSHRIKLSTIAALGALGLSIDASAQGRADDPIDAIDGISSYEVLPDDTLLITLESGETLTLTSDAYVVIGEQVFLRESGATLVQAAIQSGVSNAGMMAAAMGLGALGGVSEIDDDGGADPIETDTTAPEFTSGASASAAENGDATTVVYDADATDSGTVSYALSGTDSALFEIDSATGELTFLAAPDFEAPGDADGDGVFEVTITASDGTNSSSLDVAITLTDTNDEAPVFTSSDSVEAVAETATDTIYTATVTDADTDASDITFSLAETGDSQYFDIDASTGEVTLKDSIDHESPLDSDGDNIYDIQITASDGDNQTTHDVSITITDAGDEAPVFTSELSASAAENTTDVVYTAQATPDVADADVTYTVDGGADAARFTIDEETGELRFLAAPDYDAAGDADGGNDYVVSLRATEADGQSDTQTVIITLTDTNDEAPVFTSANSVTGVPEGQRGAIYTATVTDADTDTSDITFSLAPGGDSDYFTIDAQTGEVTPLSTVDHDAPLDSDDDNIYDIQIIASDGDNQTTHDVSITITDAGDEAPVFTSELSASTAENTTDVVYTAQATPDVADADVTYTIDGGADAARFTIDEETGELRFLAAPDHDVPEDTDQNNDYLVTIRATEADGQSVTQTITISVTGLDDEAPVFTSANSVTGVPEGQRGAIYTATVTDADTDTSGITFSLASGGDSDYFTIDAQTGEVTPLSTVDHDAPLDSDDDNIYDIQIIASDGENEATHDVAIAITDVADEAPVFTSGTTASMDEERTDTGYVAAATPDMDGARMFYTINGGEHRDLFVIDSHTGKLSFETAPDFEEPFEGYEEAGNTYEVTIQATDGYNTSHQTVIVTVEDIDEDAPFFSYTVVDVNVDENTPSSTVVFDANATDADGDHPNTDDAGITYTLGGEDAASFTIDQETGEVTFNDQLPAPDHENPADEGADNTYDITISATDVEGKETDLDVTITVDDVSEEGPVFTSGTAASVMENETDTGYTAQATPDVDGESIDYSIVGGLHGDLFTIDPATGELTFDAAPDHEAPLLGHASQGYVEYAINGARFGSFVRNESYLEELSASFNGEFEVGEFLSTSGLVGEFYAGTVDIGEHTMIVTSVGEKFRIRVPSGIERDGIDWPDNFNALTLSTDPYTLEPSNDYIVEIEARDESGNTSTQVVTIAVTDEVGDGPGFTSPLSGTRVFENESGTVYTAVAVPELEGGVITYELVLDTGDSNLFFIDEATGDLSFISPPDFEDPRDYNTDNTYVATIRAIEEGGGATTQTVSVQVLDAEAREGGLPSISAPNDVSLNEGSESAFSFSASDTDALFEPLSLNNLELSGPDAALFEIEQSSANEISFFEVSFTTAPDYENPQDDGQDNIYNITLIVTDNQGQQSSQDIQIVVNDVVENGPVFTSGTTASVDENVTDTVYTAEATPDVDGAEVTYEITGGADSERFTLNETTGELAFGSAPDHEAPGDMGDDNIYEVEITATENGGSSSVQTISVTVNDTADEHPVFTSGTTASVDENVTNTVYTAQATPDVDSESIEYSIVGGLHGDLFSINSSTGELTFDTAPDHEAPPLRYASQGYAAYLEDTSWLVGTVAPGEYYLEEAPDSAVGEIDGAFEIDESLSTSLLGSETYLGTVDIGGHTMVVTLAAGRYFIHVPPGIDPDEIDWPDDFGDLMFSADPYTLEPSNDYSVEVEATDESGNTSTQVVTITVEDIADNDPVFTSGTTASVDEGVTDTVYTAEATPDVDGAEVTYEITGGADMARFTLNETTGELEFGSAPDFEAPGDTDRNNIYEVEITATENGDRSSVQTVTITVEDIADNDPVFTSATTTSVNENEPGTVYTAQATPDVDGESITYSIVGGPHGDLFSINPDTGELTFNTAPDHEAPTFGWASGNSAVWVGSDITGAPAFLDNSFDVLFTEAGSATGGTWNGEFAVGEPVSEDGDHSGLFFYGTLEKDGQTLLVFQSGSGNVFAVVGPADTGSGLVDLTGLSLSQVDQSPWSLPVTNDYQIEIEATDESGNTSTQVVTITVEDTADNDPVFTSATTASVDENETNTGYTPVAEPDVDGAEVTYAITGGVDMARFTLNETTGELEFGSAPDFEAPGDTDRNNIYEVEITATENGDRSSVQTVTITVEDIAEGPVFTSATTASVDENKTVTGYTAQATPEVDGESIDYSIVGGDHGDLFSINSSTGELTFNTPPDHEAPQLRYAGQGYVHYMGSEPTYVSFSPNEYYLEEYSGSSTGEIDGVFDVGEQVRSNSLSVQTYLGTVDIGGHTMVVVSSTGRTFIIVPTGIELDGITWPDNIEPSTESYTLEPRNEYSVEIEARDESGNTSIQTVTITVEDTADNDPVFTSGTTASVNEGLTKTGFTPVAEPDVDGAEVTYAITGGADMALFRLNETTGELEFKSVPDHEAPDDIVNGEKESIAGDNVYEVVITATENGDRSSAQTISVTVNDIADEDPVFTSGTMVSVDEGLTGTGLFPSADPDIAGDAVFYSVVGGAHEKLFIIDPTSGELKFDSEPDFEAPVSAHASIGVILFGAGDQEHTIELSEYVITENSKSTVGVEDGTLELGESVLINGEDTGEIFAGYYNASLVPIIVTASEQTDGSTDFHVYVPPGIDVDALLGVLPHDLDILLTLENFDLPETNDYQVVVEANEGGRTTTQTITITVEDVSEDAPLTLSGFGLSTVKMDAELLEELEGTVVSTPTDPAAPQTLPSTPTDVSSVPEFDWFDDGFAAAQMQLDMSDALDGL